MHPENNLQYDIVIIGGGMVGQAFALSMVNKGLKITVIEPNNPNPELQDKCHTRVSAITPKSEIFLKNIGVWELIKRKYAFTDTYIWDQNSHGSLNFNKENEGVNQLGYIIENDAIQSAIYTELEKAHIAFIRTKLTNIHKIDDGYQLDLTSNQKITCGLLIGADGTKSNVRELAGIEYIENNYQQKAIVCNIESLQSFQSTTWQRFLSDSIIALLPFSERQASIVWSAENHLADELIQLSAKQFADRLAQGVEYKFGRFKVISNIQAFPLIGRNSQDYVKHNLALIGDAAHNMHPLAGQGVNLGFLDVAELSQQLQTNNKLLGDYLVLRKYARARRLNNELMAKTITGLNWIYKENSEPLRWLRGFGMNLINESPILKYFLQKQASGDTPFNI
ncbi:2-octaprenyl-3-methyl-6-methoxy-1,4-benzoquinol hydroxylase [Candidatus Ruthia magnifica str. Cm (Calyptogena magnifica)]|uniref:2-octaprenyl-3-methyl-6-methoxy-1,4-benzoquinol hydroxylase n=1 Tax=Ruthia magnifica subsp. Calyptogena magnifica TaxID=413404 RepID=A1AXM2_RUTMC|nr:UbiH/UbiF/VisC/COQ6 family ubiquinone biosynthesis hydroxylase [Candidatus Ruthturnera calyptogenae]ABL02679.1 2-octaprenyl-3-methyl-6-methoxy-1,4-benzoquinol hydroxylase [Candidatus Ruthia magnifica str. Cm (Calyptogena magnifica)]